MICIFNSISLRKDSFKPLDENTARIFICGPTLYDFTHLGHARIFLTYDLMCRHLNQRGIPTDVLVNMTDINQNVFNKAALEGRDYREVAHFYANAFADDLSLLNIRSVSRLAYVSDFLESIKGHILKLLDDDFAYYANGNVYLDSSKLESYGNLSRQSQDQLLDHRLDIGPHKKNQTDIMLWNCSEEFDFTWDSKFGQGIPWWHIQDTAVAFENFGINYDIHGGARELLYPHHEAHLAQYKLLSKSNNPVGTWMHVGLVTVCGEKMSKSLGNVVWSKDLVRKHGQNLLRLYLFSSHYRSDIAYEEKVLVGMKSLLQKAELASLQTSGRTDNALSKLVEEFSAALDDDLDSPRALSVFEKICSMTISGSNLDARDFKRICDVLGLEI